MAVVFDLDGTLIDSLDVHARSVKAGIDRVLGKSKVNYKFIRSNIRYPTSMLFRLLNEKLDIRLTMGQKMEILREKRRVMSKEGFGGVKLYKGVREILVLLRKNRIKTCIATSMPKRELPILRRSKAMKALSDLRIFYPDRMGHEKPDPFVLNKAAAAMYSSRENAVYVGDSLTDAEASKNAGMMFIGVFNRKFEGREEYFKNMEQLLVFLRNNLEKFR